MNGDTETPLASNDGSCQPHNEPNNTHEETPQQEPETAPTEFVVPEIRKKIEQEIESKGVTDYTMVIEPGSSVGDNFMGFIAKVTVTGLNINKETATLNWIVKIAPLNELYRSAMKVELLYEREIYMYETIFPEMAKFQEEKSILEPFNNYPKFAFSHMEPLQECFAMENVKLEGYVMRDRKEPLNYDHVKLLMKTYAKFHAVSLAMKDQKPEEFAELGKNTKDVISVTQDNADAYKTFQMILEPTLGALDEKTDQKVINKYKKFFDNFLDITNEAVNMTNRYSVIGHADSWINNMLWKYEDLSDQTTPTRACLLDFQLARYASPACDLSYFLFTCTDKSLRDKHYDDAIRLYYYTLCGHLSELGSDPEKVFPFSALEEELKRFSVVGMFWTLVVLFTITRDSDEIPDMKDDSLSEEEITKQFNKKSKNHNQYSQRVRDVIYDCCQKGYLDFLQ